MLRNRSAVLPEKDSLLQSFRQAFFKRPRTPLAAYPFWRVPLLPRTSRLFRSLFQQGSEAGAFCPFSGSAACGCNDRRELVALIDHPVTESSYRGGKLDAVEVHAYREREVSYAPDGIGELNGIDCCDIVEHVRNVLYAARNGDCAVLGVYLDEHSVADGDEGIRLCGEPFCLTEYGKTDALDRCGNGHALDIRALEECICSDIAYTVGNGDGGYRLIASESRGTDSGDLSAAERRGDGDSAALAGIAGNGSIARCVENVGIISLNGCGSVLRSGRFCGGSVGLCGSGGLGLIRGGLFAAVRRIGRLGLLCVGCCGGCNGCRLATVGDELRYEFYRERFFSRDEQGIDKIVWSTRFRAARRTIVRRGAKSGAEKAKTLNFMQESVRIPTP